MDVRKVITFFRRYALLVIVLVSVTACSAVYAGIYVNNLVSGELANATISAVLVASVPTKWVAQAPTVAYNYVASVPANARLGFTAGYSCALIVNASGVLSTVPCFTTTTSSSTTTTASTTTTTVAGGGAVGGGGLPVGAVVTAPSTPTPSYTNSQVLPFGLQTITKTIHDWIVALGGTNTARLLLGVLVLGLLLLLFAGGSGKKGRRR